MLSLRLNHLDYLCYTAWKKLSYCLDEGELMNTIRTRLQTLFPVCGDLLIGETKIRRMPLGEVNVPSGAQVLISNNRHAFKPSAPEDMRQRRDALLDKEFPYHLFNLNCEHFATFIRYGKAVCNQVWNLARQAKQRVFCHGFNSTTSPPHTKSLVMQWENGGIGGE